MKDFLDLAFDSAQCRQELDEFATLLWSKADLSERADLQPFFRSRHQLTSFIGALVPFLGPANRIAYEFSVIGDFTADIILGNKERGEYCLIELEDARRDSIFTSVKGKATKEWGRRFEHGFSQLVDWFWSLDDVRKTNRFSRDFGCGHITFAGILLIGRSHALSENERNRLKWRTDAVPINNHKIHCFTLDDLHKRMCSLISNYSAASRLE